MLTFTIVRLYQVTYSDLSLRATKGNRRQAPVVFTLLKSLRDRVEGLPDSVPVASSTGPLGKYFGDPSKLTQEIADDNMLWELRWDSEFNDLLPHQISCIHPLVLRGDYGLIGVVRIMEHLVRDRGVGEFFFEGKVGRLLKAIDEVCIAQQSASMTSESPCTGSKTADTNGNVSGDGTSAPAAMDTSGLAPTKARKAGKKQGGGTSTWRWKIPEEITPYTEAARDWQETRDPGKKKLFEAEWKDGILQDSERLAIYQKRAAERREAQKQDAVKGK
ncbi:hypothetical protein V5O48_019057 [Marasmius crinis-equi]|uniref:Uncharacterized protein n=1 Tax=Marasmius crinis-equi TaxID=585013 RepID=A0ABR3EJG1_9AGAR